MFVSGAPGCRAQAPESGQELCSVTRGAAAVPRGMLGQAGRGEGGLLRVIQGGVRQSRAGGPRLSLPKFKLDSGPHWCRRAKVVPRPAGQYTPTVDTRTQAHRKEEAEGSGVWRRIGGSGHWPWSAGPPSPTGRGRPRALSLGAGRREEQNPQAVRAGKRAPQQSPQWGVGWTVRVTRGLSESSLRGWSGQQKGFQGRAARKGMPQRSRLGRGVSAQPEALARAELCLKSPGGHGGPEGRGAVAEARLGPASESTTRQHRPPGRAESWGCGGSAPLT